MTSSTTNKLVCFFVVGILGCSSMMGIMSIPSMNPISIEEESVSRIDSSSRVNPMADWLIPDVDGNSIDSRDHLDLYRNKAVSISHYRTSQTSDTDSGFELSYTTENDYLSIVATVEDYGITTYAFDEGEFNALVIPSMELSDEYGNPVLPYKKLMFNIPSGMEVLSVQVTSVSTEQIFGLKLVPGPKPVAIYGDLGPDPTLFFEPAVYSSDSMTPFDIVESHVVSKGTEEALMLTVSPLQYNPLLKQGLLHSKIIIDVSFSEPVTTEEVIFLGWSNYGGANYTIITTTAFLSILTDFIDWKTSIGFDIQVETVEDILVGYSGRDNPEKVRTFINAAYAENNTDYFLLVGDCDIVPVREVWDPADAGLGLDNLTLPSDFYYECLDGTWDDNGNDLFGELDDDVDLFPEVKVGRLPVQLPSEAEHVLSQIISYESNPQDGDWMNDFMLIAVDCFGSGDGVVMSEGELNQKYLFDSFYDVFRFYPTDGSLSNAAVLAKMNSGVGIVDFFDHGAYDVWVDAMDYADALDLENGNKSFFAFAMACETAAFDAEDCEPTIGEAFFRSPLGGASTYIGATRIAWAGQHCFDGFHNHFWEFFMNAALTTHEARPKDAFHESLNYMATTFDTTNGPTLEVFYQAIYFGDPALAMSWKHNVTTTTEIVEVDETVTVNGTCQLYNNRPIVDNVDVTVTDPVGLVVYSGTEVTDSEGKYSISLTTSSTPGEYTVETNISQPFEYIATTTFDVGTLDVDFSLDNDAIYNTFLNFTGTIANDCSGSVILQNDHNVEITSKVIASSGGTFSDSINLTEFGALRLLVQFDNGTATGGYHIDIKVIKGEILIIADNAGDSGPDYPGGWADDNFGDASNPGDYVIALQEEYNVTVFWTMHETAPSLSLLNQYDVVIVTTGDNYGNPLNSPDAYLLDVLTDYHNSGGDIMFEGGAILSALQVIELNRFPNLFHVSFTGPISNTGSLELTHSGHQIMSGLPLNIPLSDELGAEDLDSFDPVNGSVHVAGYSGNSGITALSPVSGVGGVVFIGFAIDAITNSDYRNLLIQNAMNFLLRPSLTITVSDNAMQIGTSDTIYIEVTDSATDAPIEGVSIDFDGCGVSISNTSKADGTCSAIVSPSSAGLITINVTKAGYLNYSTFIIVYDIPVISLEASPEFLERSTMTRVTITATDYYEHNPLDNCFVNISGLGIIESGYTNTSGMIDFDIYTDVAGIISVTGNLSGFVNASIILPVRINILVLEGAGTIMSDNCCWDELMLNWNYYGDYPLYIDYTTFQNSSVNLDLDLLHTLSPDVISFGFPMDSYSTSDIDAIQDYVEEGHGLVLGGGAMYYNAESWDTFMGFSDLGTLEGVGGSVAEMTLIEDSHPVFRDVSNPYTPGYPILIYPGSTGWDVSVLHGATYIAKEDVAVSRNVIATYRGLVFCSAIQELSSNNDDCQFLYNAFVWSDYVIPDHDLSVNVDVPLKLDPMDSTLIEATVVNSGLEIETSISLRLFIDDVQVDYLSVASLDSGASETLEYFWTPSVEGIYNVTVSVDQIPEEYTYANNAATKMVAVKSLHDYTMTEVAFSWYDAETNGVNLMMSGDDTSRPVSLPFDFSYYNAIFETVYVSSNGWFSFDNPNPHEYYNVPYPSTDIDYQYALAPLWDDLSASNDVYYWSTAKRVVIQYSDYEYLGGSLLGTFQVVLNENGTIQFNYLYIDTVYDGTVGLNHGDGIHYNSFNSSLLADVNNFSLSFDYLLTGHDIAVNLVASDYTSLDIPTDLTAVVRNLRNETEYNVELTFNINSVEVSGVLITDLSPFEVFEYSYSWIPTLEGPNNVSVEVSPVPDEVSTVNNEDSKFIIVTKSRSMAITSPSIGQTVEGGLVLVEFETEEIENISLFEVSINDELVISLSGITESEIMVPLFENGTNEIELYAQWIDTSVANDSVSIQSLNIINMLDPEPGDFYHWYQVTDPYYIHLNYTFGNMINAHEVEVNILQAMFNETEVIMMAFDFDITVNLLNGYISEGLLAGYHLFFISGLRSPDYTGAEAEIGDMIVMHQWFDNPRVDSFNLWEGYAVWRTTSVSSNVSASVFRGNGILATLEVEEETFGWVTNTSFYPASDTNPPEWAIPLSDIIVEAGEFFSHQFSVFDETGINSFTVNDTTRFSLSLSGILSNRVDLAVGNYGIELNATDALGNSLVGQLTVISLDTTSPSWRISTNFTLLSESIFEAYLEVADFSGIDHFTVNDTRFAVNSTGWLTSTDVLEAGIYHVEITAYDPYDNENSIVLTIIVLPPSGPNEELSRLFMIVVFTTIFLTGIVSCFVIRKGKSGT